MLSINDCKDVLESSGQQYSVQEAKEIRELLYQLAHLEFENYKKLKSAKSSNLYASFNGRTKEIRF